MLCFRRGFGLGANRTRRCFLNRAPVASGKKSCGRTGASWALLSRAPCSRPGFTVPSRNKQTQPRPCSSMRGLGWHSAYSAVSRRRQGLPFCSGVQVDRGLGQCLPQPEETRQDHCTRPAPGNGEQWVIVRPSPGNPLPPPTLQHPGGRRHLTARCSRSCFFEFRAGRLVASTCLHHGQVAKELLYPWAQRHRTGLPSAQTPSSEGSTRSGPSRPLVSP